MDMNLPVMPARIPGTRYLSRPLQQPEGLEAGRAAARDHEVIVHRDAQRLGGAGDLARHLDVGAAGRGIAAGMIVQLPSPAIQPLEITNNFVIWGNRWGVRLGAVERDPM